MNVWDSSFGIVTHQHSKPNIFFFIQRNLKPDLQLSATVVRVADPMAGSCSETDQRMNICSGAFILLSLTCS